MKKAIAITAAAAVAGFVAWRMMRQPAGPVPDIPALLARSLPDSCRQVMLVLSTHDTAIEARLWLLERRRAGHPWRIATGPLPVTLGRNGLAWGLGDHDAPPPAGFRTKVEGDGCSPAGVFQIPFAFGVLPAEDAPWLRLPYTPLTPNIVGVEDPKSRFYNQVIDNTHVEMDWDIDEPMVRNDRLYEWGAFVGHNPQRLPNAGSCIFLHLWPGPGRPTAGCTAMDAASLRQVLAWLDPTKDPRLVQGLEGW